MQQLREFDGKKMVCITKEGFKLDETPDEKARFEQLQKQYAPLMKHFKSVLEERVEKVELSQSVVSVPCVLISAEYGWSANMERIMRSQALRDNSLSNYMASKKILQLNATHSVMKTLSTRFSQDPQDKTVKDLITLLYDTALLNSGFVLDNPVDYSTRIFKMIKLGLACDEDEEDSSTTTTTTTDMKDLPPLEASGTTTTTTTTSSTGENPMERVD